MDDKFKEHLLFKPERMNLPHFVVKPMGTGVGFVHKWIEFLRYLLDRSKVGVVILESVELLIPPPATTPVASSPLKVYYRPNRVLVPRVPAAGPSMVNHTGQQAPQGDLSLFNCALWILQISGFMGVHVSLQIIGTHLTHISNITIHWCT